MTTGRDSGRRAVLAVLSIGVTGLAGCQDTGGGPGAAEDDAGPEETEADGSGTTDTGTSGSGTTEPEPGGSGTTDADGGDTGTTEDGGDETPADSDESPTDGDSAVTATPELDLREANVTAVDVESADGEYEFAVTLYHDDDGEDGYANWWQVETLEGEQLGRRELLHAHSTDPFTRSETVAVPDDVACVVVRGHDQTHGYGGQAMLVDVESGDSRARRQGAERTSFSQSDCP